MKNFYGKTQLSWSKRLLRQLYIFDEKDPSNLFYTNSELDFLAYLVLRSYNEPNHTITFTRKDLNEVFDNKIDSKRLSKIFKRFNVVKVDGKYKFTYTNIFLYNRLKKGMNDYKYIKAPYGSMPIETWLKIREHKGKYTRRLALYILFIENDFAVMLDKVRFRIGMYERNIKNKGRDLKLIQESLNYFTDINFIKRYKVYGDKILIQYKGNKTFEQLNGQVSRPNLSSKREKIIDYNNAMNINKELSQEPIKENKDNIDKTKEPKPKSKDFKLDTGKSKESKLKPKPLTFDFNMEDLNKDMDDLNLNINLSEDGL